jgi:hypothetical protein
VLGAVDLEHDARAVVHQQQEVHALAYHRPGASAELAARVRVVVHVDLAQERWQLVPVGGAVEVCKPSGSSGWTMINR